MADDVVDFERVRLQSKSLHGQHGLYALRDLPQRPSVSEHAYSPGWHELEQLWKLYDGQLTVVTGVAGSGKSTLLFNVVCNLAHQYGVRTFMYVPENEAHVIETLRSIWDTRTGWDYFAQHQCYVQSAVPDHIDEAPRTLQRVLDLAIATIEHENVGLVLIDPWNELEHAKPRDMSMTDYIRVCLMHIKQFARSWNVTTIIVAHPTKAGVEQGKTPGLADIEGSMSWFNKCDNGLIVVRDPEKSTAKVISAKVRERGAGRRGTCFFYVDPNTGLFTPQYGGVTL